MLSEEKITLSKTRLSIAKERIAFADEILSLGDYKTVANRSYYAVFSAMRAVLALDGFDSKKHSGLIAHFRQEYIKTGIIDVKYSDMIQDLSQFRNDSDYNILAVITLSDAQEQYANAKDFVSMIDDYIKMRLDIK